MEEFLPYLDSIYNSLLCLQEIIIPTENQELLLPKWSNWITLRNIFKKEG